MYLRPSGLSPSVSSGLGVARPFESELVRQTDGLASVRPCLLEMGLSPINSNSESKTISWTPLQAYVNLSTSQVNTMGKINNPGYAGRAVREVLGPAVAGFVEGPAGGDRGQPIARLPRE